MRVFWSALRRSRSAWLELRARFARRLIDRITACPHSLPLTYRVLAFVYLLKRLVQKGLSERRWPPGPLRRFLSHEFESNLLIRLVAWRDWPVRKPPDLYSTIVRNNVLTNAERIMMQSHMQKLPDRPLLSVVVPVYNAEPAWIDRLVHSLLDQTYDRWELILVDDASPSRGTALALSEVESRDDRITVERLAMNGGVVRATEAGIALSHGSWIAFVDHDDTLMPDALWWVAKEIIDHPSTDVIYTDEEIHHDGTDEAYPHFKPAYSPQKLQSFNYICHLLVVRREAYEAVGGLRVGTEGAQDFDLLLRLSERTDRFRHIARVLYRWHVVARSMSRFVDTQTKSLTQSSHLDETTRRVVQEHFDRIGSAARAEVVSHWVQPRFIPTDRGRVSIVICTKDQPARLKRCISSIETHTDYPNYEIVIVDNGSTQPKALMLLEQLKQRHRVERIESGPEGFNYARLNNRAFERTSGPIVLFLNDDTYVLRENWLSAMVETLHFPQVQAVGARLLYPNRLNQHAGLIYGALGWGPWHALIGLPADNPHYGGYFTFPHNCSGVTGACLLTRRETFASLGGFDETELAVSFNDADFCLRVVRSGGRIAYAPGAELIHDEGASRGRYARPSEVAAMKRRSHGYVDPYWNEQLWRHSPHFAWSCRRRSRRLGIVARPRVAYVPPTRDRSELTTILEALQNDSTIELQSFLSDDTIESADVVLVEGNDLSSLLAIDNAHRLGRQVVWHLPRRLRMSPTALNPQAHLLATLERMSMVYQVVFADAYSIGWGLAGLPRPNVELISRTLDDEPAAYATLAHPRQTTRADLFLADTDICLWTRLRLEDHDSLAFLVGVMQSLPAALRAKTFLLIETEPLPAGRRLPLVRNMLRKSGLRIALVHPADEFVHAADVMLAHELVDPRPEWVMRGLAHGLPLVTTPLVESGDLIHRPMTGRVALPFHRPEWSRALAEILSSPKQRESLGEEGRFWLESRETRRDTLPQWRNLLLEAAELTLACGEAPGLSPSGPLEQISPVWGTQAKPLPVESPQASAPV